MNKNSMCSGARSSNISDSNHALKSCWGYRTSSPLKLSALWENEVIDCWSLPDTERWSIGPFQSVIAVPHDAY